MLAENRSAFGFPTKKRHEHVQLSKFWLLVPWSFILTVREVPENVLMVHNFTDFLLCVLFVHYCQKRELRVWMFLAVAGMLLQIGETIVLYVPRGRQRRTWSQLLESFAEMRRERGEI